MKHQGRDQVQRMRSTRMPSGRDLAPQMLHRNAGHGEAFARVSWRVQQHALGVITGEVGGQIVATQAATAALDTSKQVVIYLPNPLRRSPRGCCTTSSPPSDTSQLLHRHPQPRRPSLRSRPEHAEGSRATIGSQLGRE